VEGRIKTTNRWDRVNLTWIVIEAFDHEGQRVHHFAQRASAGQFRRAVEAEKVAEICALHLRAAELIDDEIVPHGILGSAAFAFPCLVQRKRLLVGVVELDSNVVLRSHPLERCEHDAHHFQA